ncbi:hypothetical protein HNY73_013320 [Argiope bruennichi]|uniref:Uncharacterized protein n=1 Tax=Argiope bruennichi TaxID=94029 RepID=A0A8T0EXN0_ARGBR|nr:hypothetical protein HNY73_013320 [Argiope bruennichi]
MIGSLSNKLESTKSKNMERKNLFFILFCVINVLNLRFCDTKHLIHNSKEVYVIRYFENQKITPVTVELDLKQQKKVAYKDTDSNQCFVADLRGETLDEDRKRLRQINSGIVKGFYIPTLTIEKVITNATEIHERFGHLVHTFCNGSDVSYVTRKSSQLSRKKRDTASSGKIGDRGQFTHHSYGHYGHQSNNYAHYGHETHITGAVDKDGNLRTQKISDHQTRSYGTQTYPPSGAGDMRQSQSTDSRSTSRDPYQQLPSSSQNDLAGNMGLGSTGQFSLQTAQESGYQLNLPFGLKAGNAYRGGIHSQGQYGVGGARPQIQTSLHRYPGSQITDTVGGVGPGHQERVTGVVQPGGGQISPGLTHTGYPSTLGIGRDGYGITDQGRGTDSLSQPGQPSILRPGIGSLQPGSGILRPDGSVIPGIDGSIKDIRISGLQPGITSPGQLLPGQRITPGGEIITDSGVTSQHKYPPSTEFRPGSYPIGPPGSITTLPSGIQVDQSGRVIPGFPGSVSTRPGGIQVDQYGRVIPSFPGTIPSRPGGIQVDQSGRVITDHSGTYPIGPPSSISTRPDGTQVDQFGRVIPSTPGSHPAGLPGSVSTRPDGAQVDQFGRVIPGSYLPGIPGSISTRPDGTKVDQFGRVIPGIPGSYPTGTPGSISTRPDGTQVDQFGRVIPGIPGSISTRPDGSQVDQFGRVIPGIPGSISTRPDGTQVDQFGRVIPGIPGSISTRPDGTQVDQFGRVIPGIPGSISTGPDGTQVDQFGRVIPGIPGSVSTRPDGTQVDQFGRVIPGIRTDGGISQDLTGRLPSQISTGTQISPGYLPGYPGYITSGDTTSRQVVGDARLTEQGRVTGIEGDRLPVQIQTGDSLRFGGGDSASSQTQIQTGSEGTAAEASSAGQYRGLGSQTQVQGGYKGNGSFSAQAQSGFTGGVTQSQVQGGKQGGLSGSSAIVEQVGSAQSQVQIGQPSGAASSSAQGRFSSGATQVQAQSSRSGGSAGAESQSSGLSSSQVQVNIGGDDGQQQNGFQGTVSASVQGGLTSGQSQTQLQGGYNSGRTYVATAQGGFDSTQGFQSSIPGSGSLPILTSLTGTSGDQQPIRTSGVNLIGTDGTPGRIPGEGRQGQIPDLSQLPSTYPGIRQPEGGTGLPDSRYQPGISQIPLTPQGVYQPSELRPSLPGSLNNRGYDSRYPDSSGRPGRPGISLPGSLQPGYDSRYPDSSGRPGISLPGSLQPGYDSRYPDSSGRPGISESRLQPGAIPSGHLPIDGRRPGYQPGSIQQPSTGVPSSVQISPPGRGLHQPGYQPGSLQPQSHISTRVPSSVQISPPRPGEQQIPYQPGRIQPPSQISTGVPSFANFSSTSRLTATWLPTRFAPTTISDIYWNTFISANFTSTSRIATAWLSSRLTPATIYWCTIISTYFASTSRIATTSYQPGSFQLPSTGIPSSVLISPSRPGLQQPGYHPGFPQPPSHISSGLPSSVQISPPRPGLQQPGYQPGLFQPPSEISSGIPSSVQISPPRPGLQQPGYQSGLFQPVSHIPSGIPPSLPGQQFVPGIQRPGILTLPSNVSRPGLPTSPPGVREPDLTDESSCCEALRNLRRRCCDRSDGKNGRADSSCCSRSNKFDNDFDLDDDSDETTNGEPCKVVKAICYIVYKPVGKARICKPTKTNGC